MWFRRLLRRRRQPPPLLQPSLERLAKLIESVVELLDQVAVVRSPKPATSSAPAPDPEPDTEPNPEPNPEPNAAPDAVPIPVPSVEGHLLVVSSPDGYQLLERPGAPPARGDLLEVEGDSLSVLRLGPSPLPGDRRRCAYVERQEPPPADRTFDR